MKVAGIVAEYNPFHNGHAYHMQKVKELTGGDSLNANIQLVLNNARLAAQTACALVQISKQK